ncbi:hypothetical protein [Treponema endosymbiont of Eucomonympha sp.]|uniref:hypothetical protein n=1 Tax=Treponema endosymbiont of Eucomonympha sp. TaxID=1580831 RepID=UPI0013969619|nr:hypothetical protein [Treponema endosymbiont of Eucomonympha sp.]
MQSSPLPSSPPFMSGFYSFTFQSTLPSPCRGSTTLLLAGVGFPPYSLSLCWAMLCFCAIHL